jgi:hypothetical protein
MLIYNHGKIEMDRSGENWLKGAEIELQQFLRRADPGLPLPPPLDESTLRGSSADHQPLELSLGQVQCESLGLEFSGQWRFDLTGVLTSDPKAKITFSPSGSKIGIVAAAASPCTGILELAEIGGGGADDDARVRPEGRQLQFEVQDSRLYRLAKGIATKNEHQRLGLSFTGISEQNPVHIYSLRSAD